MYYRFIILLVILFAEQIQASVIQKAAPEFVISSEEARSVENLKTVTIDVDLCKYDETSLGLFAGGRRHVGQDQKKQLLGPLQSVEEATEPTTVKEDKKNEEQDAAEISVVTELPNKSDWYIDAINGDDDSGDGSQDKPFRSIKKLFSINESHESFLGSGDTLHLAAGNYNQDDISVDIPGLNITGTLNEFGKPVSVLGEISVFADGVILMNCEFLNAGVILNNVENVAIYGSIFSGKTKTCLSLFGASNNLISRNDFRSATQNAVLIDWDPVSAKTSTNNLFLKNYFTHHPSKTTKRVILVNFNKNNNSACSRNRFVSCAFEELAPGQLSCVVDDYNPPSMVAEHEYSVRFEDCYFKRADRAAPFSELTFTKKKSDLHWKWDELIDDKWVAPNEQYAITGDRENEYVPRVQFIDGNNNGTPFESNYSAGLFLLEEELKDQVQVDASVAVAKADESLVESVDLSLEKNAPAKDDGSSLELIDMPVEEAVPAEDNTIYNRSEWYVDTVKGDDESGNGSESNPFRSIYSVLTLNEVYPSYVGPGDTLHLAAGNYGLDSMEIDIQGLNIKGTLDDYGKPVSVFLDDVKIISGGVTLINCKFQDVGLILQNVENVHISNNVFSGSTAICLSLIGSSNNKISHNEFRSAIYDCVHIYWDPKVKKVSNDNFFLKNYFTHRPNKTTDRVIRVSWSPGNNDSISARNRFVSCAFRETVNGHLKRVIDDDSTWWMVVDHQYSVQFEDCYFKRADRKNPFKEFVILKGFPEFKWRWDELVKDIWVAANIQFSLTGDYKNWNHKPRLQFVDGNKNGSAFEMTYKAGLLPSGNKRNINKLEE